MKMEIWPIIASFCVAFVGYFIQHLYALRLQVRKDQLDRVNAQLRQFYGPLLAVVSATKSSFSAFLINYSPAHSATSEGIQSLRDAIVKDINGPEAKEYRLWMKEILMPLNTRASELLINNADLFDAPQMPHFFLELVAHVSSFRVLLKKWEMGDFSKNFADVPYPNEIHYYIVAEFTRLKQIQARLLGNTENLTREQKFELRQIVDYGPVDPRKKSLDLASPKKFPQEPGTSEEETYQNEILLTKSTESKKIS